MLTHNYILSHIIETTANAANDRGEDSITVTLDFNDVKIILDGLKRLEPTAAADYSKIVPVDSPLSDTVEGMLHPDYKERFKAEYNQTKIRYEKLKAFNTKIEAAQRTQGDPFAPKKVDEPTHDCPASLLREQQTRMGEYLHILEVRAVIEGVDLD